MAGMSLDTYTFFLIVIGGLMVVWSFRKVTRSTKDIKEIEYLVFACVWGTLLVIVYAQMSSVEKLSQLLNNPFASGLVFTLMGLLVGSFFATMDNRYRLVSKLVAVLEWVDKKVLG